MTVNPYEIELLTTQYSTSLMLLLQQMNSRLRGAVLTGNHVGKMASPVQYIGALQFKQAGPRGSPLEPQIAQYQRRWVFPQDKDLPVQVDTFDELKSIVDPKSGLSMAVQAAANRLFDDVIIQAYFGSAFTGVDSSSLSTETFDSGSNWAGGSVSIADTFGAGTATGLTAKKLIEGRRILRHYENDLEGSEVHVAIGSQQEADLLNQIEVISREYREVPVLEDGRIRRFLGCTFHYSERLQTSSGDRLVPMWITDGMYLGLWKDMQTIISQRTDLTGAPWQAYSMISLGATRMQAGKLVKIACLDATGNDITV